MNKLKIKKNIFFNGAQLYKHLKNDKAASKEWK